MKINAFIFFFLASLVAQGQICFEPAKNYATSRNICSTDFNNDEDIVSIKRLLVKNY